MFYSSLSICGLLEKERAGLLIDGKLLRDAIGVLKGCSLYEAIVVLPHMSSAARYYSALSRRLIPTLDAGEYEEEIERCIGKEVRLIIEYMDPKYENEIVNIILNEMVGDYMIRLVFSFDSHRNQLIHKGSYDDIDRMFKLVLKLPGSFDSLTTALNNYIRRTLTAMVSDKKKGPIEYIQVILDERDKIERIIRQFTVRDMRLINMSYLILREISGGNFQLPEFLSLYMDHILVQEGGDYSAALDKTFTLIADLDDKATFQIYYQRHLADRLLSGSYNEELERNVLLKLRGHCCPHFLHKLGVMISDMTISQSVMSNFYESNLAPDDATSICVRILRTNFWPMLPLTVCKLPGEIMKRWELFCAYYLSLYDGRKLTWCPILGNAIINARFGCDCEYELTVPMYHMCILMLFNSADTLTFAEIQQKTCIPRDHLKSPRGRLQAKIFST